MVRTATTIVTSLFSYAVSEGLLSSDFERGRIGIMFAVIASELSIWEGVISEYQAQCFLQTVTNETLEGYLIEPLHTRTPAKPSDVIVKFYWGDTPTEQRTNTTIPYLQQIETAEENPVVYQTVEAVTLYADQDYTTVRARSYNYGADTMVDANELLNLNPSTTKILVTNPQPSWGGMDQEDLDTAKANAFAMRYNTEKGTRSSMELALINEGLKPYQYNLVDNAFGYGSFALYVNTQSDDLINDVKEILDANKAQGIYYVCKKATPVSVNFNFDIKLNGNADLLPNVRDALKADILSAFETFILKNGVGQKIILSKAVYHLFEQLLPKYEIYDIQISTVNTSLKTDTEGNLELEDDQVVTLGTYTINLTIGD